MAGSLNVDKRPIVNSGGIIYSTTNMTTNKCGGHEPPDVFCGLASLIVEGRVPRPDGGKDGRGVHHEEGPHALKHHGPGGNILHGHECSGDDYMCKKDENFRKHMLLLWQNNVPVSIEVLLCSDCRVGRQKANSVEYSTIPEPGSILLEQWTVSISNNFKRKEQRATVGCTTATLGNFDQHTITSRGLFQAVRSYLHFSQLSAWYDSFRGTAPSSVLYRITIPGEAFASKFTCQPENHYFPPAAVGSKALVNVAVRSYPRTDKIPQVICTHNTIDVITHSPTALSSSPSNGDILASGSSSTSISPTCGPTEINGDQTTDSKFLTPVTHTAVEDNKLAMAGALSWKETERLETDLRRMTLVKNKMTECTLTNTTGATTALPRSDSMDSMLGDSLLDPPQDLQKMPPKRYQSPSRCGSPSIEAPDHLLFRSHYHYNENTSNVSQLYSTVGTSNKNSESARNRLARQDLLRRRDIGQTLGISGSCHGLHPRMLLSIGQNQPRLSLPPKTVAPIVNQVMPTSGPYRAFPPERGMQQFTPFMQRTPCSHSVVPNPCGLSEEVGQLSQLVDRMQVKCNITGKHICKSEAHGEEYNKCSNIGKQDINKAPQDKEIYDVEGTEYSDNNTKEEKLKEEMLPTSFNTSRPLTESTSSFILGGAKKKSAISINQANKKYDQIRSPNTTRTRHYKQIESDEDDTGIEVAEYDINDINNTLLSRHLPRDYETANKKINTRQNIFQQELDEILDGLAPEKEKCSSRRSSLKDEDRLFPHKCKCTTGSSQFKLDPLDQACSKSSIPKAPMITQVYRAETETPPLISSPLLHAKPTNGSSNRGHHSAGPAKALDKADILMGAILRTCERNKHLEKEDDLHSTDSSSSSKVNSYSLGVVRKTPDERKNSAGDADDEEEGENTSSDNGSSILSSPTSSDEEEAHFALSKKTDNAHWYNHRSRDIPIRSRKKKVVPETFSNRKFSDTSSSSLCLSGQPMPSTKPSMRRPSLTLNHIYSDQLPPADYEKPQNVCDMEETCPSSENCFVQQCDECKKEAIEYEKMYNNKIIRSDDNNGQTYQHRTTLESSKKLNSDNLFSENIQAKEVHKYAGPNFTSVTTNRVQTNDSQKCQDGSDTKNYERHPNVENKRLNYPYQGRIGFTRLRTMSENLPNFPSETNVKEFQHGKGNAQVQDKLILSQNQHDGEENNTNNKIFSDTPKHGNDTNLEPSDAGTWFDVNYGTDFTLGNNGRYECGKENDFQDLTLLESLNQKAFANEGKVSQPCNINNSKEASANDATTNINGISIPTMVQKDYFRKTLNSATSMVFHRKTGLPLSSSPAPLRKGKHDFGYDSSINTPTAIKRALYLTSNPSGGCSKVNKKQHHVQRFNLELNPSDNEDGSQEVEDCMGTEELEGYESEKLILYRNKKKRQATTPNGEEILSKKRSASFKGLRLLSASAPAAVSSQGTTANNLLGTFEESVLNGRLEPVSTVEGFTAEIGASGSFHPKHKTLPVTVFFYNMCCDNSPSISSPYLGHINLGKKGYRVPQSGTIQVTLFNPLGTVVKMFVVMYDLADMPPNSQTFLRQRTFYMPTSDSICENERDAMEISRDGSLPVGASQKWLRYLVHLRFASSKSGKIYLHTDVRMIIFRKSDLDTATDHNTTPGKLGGFELRSFTNGPINPKFSPRKINFRQEE